MRVFKKILLMDLINLYTNPIWLFYSTGFPIILVLVLGALTAGSYGDTVTFFDYYGIAMGVYGMFNAATFSANSFMEERIKSPNMRIVYSPVPSYFIHFSKTLAAFVFCAVNYTFVSLFLGIAVGVNFGGVNFWAPFVLMLLSVFFFSALGVLVSCIFKSEGITNQILTLLLTILAVLGGIFFPVDGLGKAIAAISWISPAKWIFTACMQIIYDNDFSLFLPVCIVLILLSGAAVALSCKIFKGEDYI